MRSVRLSGTMQRKNIRTLLVMLTMLIVVIIANTGKPALSQDYSNLTPNYSTDFTEQGNNKLVSSITNSIVAPKSTRVTYGKVTGAVSLPGLFKNLHYTFHAVKISIPKIKAIKATTIRMAHTKGMTIKYIRAPFRTMPRMNSAYKAKNTRY